MARSCTSLLALLFTTALASQALFNFVNVFKCFIVVKTPIMRSVLLTDCEVYKILLCTCRHKVRLSGNYSSCVTEILSPVVSSSPLPPAPKPLAATILSFASTSMSGSWKYEVFVPRLACFT